MPPKLNRRQQRELEELEALKANQLQGAVDSDEEEEVAPLRHAKPGTFAQLMSVEEHDESEPEETKTSGGGGKSRKTKKKKKRAVATEHSTPSTPRPDQPSATSPQTAKSEKKALKKAKAKEKKSSMDELDQALAELSIKYPETHKQTMSSTDSQSFSKLLSVSLAHLDSEAELRKFFGSKVVQANKAASSSASSSTSRHIPTGALRSHLTKPKPTWWAARQREGLSIRAYTHQEVDENLNRHAWNALGDEKWWSVEYSKKYKSMTKAFMRTVLSGDPQGFWDLINGLPWHADTLLQLAEIYQHREEWAQAVDFVDRALFTYERSFIGAFNFTSGQHRLDFDRVENRPFFLAVHRQITDLQRRGCVRTAFEFARLLYSLDPWSDPHGSLLHLDFLALKAPGMNQWLLDVYDIFLSRRKNRPKEKQDTRADPSVLPGWAYSRALAMWMVEDGKRDKDHKPSSEALKEAVLSFPSVVPLLADKIEASIPNSIRAHRDFKVEVDGAYMSLSNSKVHMLSHLYAQHAFGIWKESTHSEWFTSVVTDLSETLPSNLQITPQREEFLRLYGESTNLRYSAYRHILVQESSYRRLFSFIPKHVTESRSFACDPLPPPTAISKYDTDFFEGVEDAFETGMFGVRTRRQREVDQRVLEQLQAVFDAHPLIAERFPGGALQFVQMIEQGQVPPETLEDMLIQLQAAFGQDGEGMPGNFGEDGEHVEPQAMVQDAVREVEVEEEDDEEEDEEEEEESSPALIRGLRNIFGRFWRSTVDTQETDSSSSDDETEPVDSRATES